MSENVCEHNKNGYCKFKETCRKRHINDHCCVKDLCVNRHCKFGDYCALEHNKKKENKSIKNALQEIEVLKTQMVALKHYIIEITQEMQEQTKMKFKCNASGFVCDTNVKLKKHKKAGHTEIIPPMDGNDTIDEEVLESVKYLKEEGVEKEIAFEIFYDKNECETQFKTEVERLWKDIKVHFGYEILKLSDTHFTVNISPDFQHGTINEDIESIIA